MIRDLDNTLQALLKTRARPGSLLAASKISFDLPDSAWRLGIHGLTLNCYLYDIRENREMRTNEPLIVSRANGTKAVRVAPPVRIDCAYCITAWSLAKTDPILEEHRLLSETLRVLLQNPTIPAPVLQGGLVNQIPPYPTIVAADNSTKNLADFWHALDQKLKPSLNYVVTLAMLLEDAPAETDVVLTVNVDAHHKTVSR